MRRPNYENLTDEEQELITLALGIATGVLWRDGNKELGERLLAIHNKLHNTQERPKA